MIVTLIMALEDDREREFMMELYLDLKPYMHQRAYAILKNYELAEDMVQESFIKLIEKASELTEMSRNQVASYVGRTVVNTSINYFNKHMSCKSKELFVDDDTAFDIPDLSPTIEEKVEIDEAKETFARILDCLSERDRALIYCKYYYDMSDKEIADILGIKQSNIRIYISRVRQRLKKQLSKEGANCLYEAFNME